MEVLRQVIETLKEKEILRVGDHGFELREGLWDEVFNWKLEIVWKDDRLQLNDSAKIETETETDEDNEIIIDEVNP